MQPLLFSQHPWCRHPLGQKSGCLFSGMKLSWVVLRMRLPIFYVGHLAHCWNVVTTSSWLIQLFASISFHADLRRISRRRCYLVMTLLASRENSGSKLSVVLGVVLLSVEYMHTRIWYSKNGSEYEFESRNGFHGQKVPAARLFVHPFGGCHLFRHFRLCAFQSDFFRFLNSSTSSAKSIAIYVNRKNIPFSRYLLSFRNPFVRENNRWLHSALELYSRESILVGIAWVMRIVSVDWHDLYISRGIGDGRACSIVLL